MHLVLMRDEDHKLGTSVAGGLTGPPDKLAQSFGLRMQQPGLPPEQLRESLSGFASNPPNQHVLHAESTTLLRLPNACFEGITTL